MVVVTTVHTPDDIRIYHRECQALVAAGYAVTLIAAAPPEAADRVVTDVTLGQRGGRLRRMAVTTGRALVASLRCQAAVYHLHDPELLPVSFALRMLGRKVVYDVHEDTPKRIRHKPYLSPPLRWFLATAVWVLEWLAGRCFSLIVAATPPIAARFPKSRCVVVQNLPKVGELTDIDTDGYVERAPVAVYIGDLTRQRGIAEICNAVRRAHVPNLRLDLVGPLSDPDLAKVLEDDEDGLLVTLGRQDRAGVKRALARARVGFVTLHPLPGYREAWPIKLFEYMAAGLPVIASDFPAWRRMLADVDAVVFVDPCEPDAIARAIEELLNDPEKAKAMGERGRQAVLACFNWDNEQRKLLAAYARLTGTD